MTVRVTLLMTITSRSLNFFAEEVST